MFFGIVVAVIVLLLFAPAPYEINIQEQIQGFVTRVIIIMVIVFVVVIGTTATYFFMANAKKLINERTDAVAQGTKGWFDAQIARVNIISDSLETADYIGTRLAGAEAYIDAAFRFWWTVQVWY